MGEALACINGITILLMALAFFGGRLFQKRITEARDRQREVAQRIAVRHQREQDRGREA